MSVKILANIGEASTIESTAGIQGQIAFATDTKKFYVSDGTQFNKITDIESNGNFYVSGNVGIGTTSLGTAKVVIDYTNTKMLELKRNGATKARFIADSNNGQLDLYDSSTVNSVRLLSSGNSYFNGGNIGIGTTSPTTKLTISQSADSNGIEVIGFDDRSTDNIKMHINSSGSGEFLSSNGLRFNTVSGQVSFLHSSNLMMQIASTSVNIRDDIELAFGNDKDYSIGYNTADDTFRIVDGSNLLSNPRLTINSTGNVGIGTTSPSQKLHVEGTSLFVGQGTWPMRMENNVASGQAELALWTVTDAYAQSETFSLVATPRPNITSRPIWYFQAAGDGWRDMTLQRYGGQVGIRTLEPSANLTVQGGGTTTGKTFLAQDSNASALFTILDNGNVGIGTTSPDHLLHVSGNAKMSNIYLLGNIIHEGDVDTQIKFATDTITFDTAGSERLTINSTGNVGIGTTSPTALLHLESAEDSVLRLKSTDNKAFITLQDDDTNTYISAENSKLSLGGNPGVNANNLNFDISNNFVGIGTSSPSAKLEIVHTDANTDTLRLGRSDNSSYWRVNHAGNDFRLFNKDASGADILFGLDSGGNIENNKVGIGTALPSEKLHVSGNIRVDSNNRINLGSTGLSLIHTSTYGEITNYTGDFIIRNTAANEDIIFKAEAGTGTDVELMRIDGSSGNVGIGTTSPAVKLDVADSEPIIRLTDTRNLNVGDWDNVSLGRIQFYTSDTTSPGARTLAEIQAYSGSGAASGPEAQLIFKTSTNSDSSPVQRMVINSQGNVGIGTTTPSYRVSSQVSADGNYAYYAANSLGSNRGGIYIDSSGNTELVLRTGAGQTASLKASGNSYFNGGNVGIGTTSPVALLTLEGAVGGDPMLRLKSTGTATSEDAYMAFNRDNTNNQGYTIGLDSGDNSFKISEDGGSITTNNRLTILTGGNVGIGTTSPTATLDIENANGVTIDINSSSGDGQFRFQDEGVTKWAIGRDNTQQNFVFSNTAGLGSDPVLVLEHGTGNVGIGTTSPSWKLDLNGGTENVVASFSSTDQTAQLRIVDSSNIPFFFGVIGTGAYITPTGATPADGISIKDTGNVGIGVASPTQKLQVQGSQVKFTSTTSGENRFMFSSGDDGNNSAFYMYNSQQSNTILINSGGNSYFNGGNVGIGTTSPTTALQVVGRTKTSELHASNGNAIYTNQGSVAIGTSQVDATAVLNIVSTTKGVLFPRMTGTQRDAIESPATGLIVYQTDATEGLYIYKSTGWTQII